MSKTIPVVVVSKGHDYEAHLDGCRDVRGNSEADTGWDVTDFDDMIRQAFEPVEDSELPYFRDHVHVAPCLKKKLP